MVLTNYLDEDGERYEYPFHLEMGNSIVYGALEEEFGTALSGVTVDTSYLFDHCLMKTKKHSNALPGFDECIFNEDPLFVDYKNFDLHLDSVSPVLGKGNPIIGAQVPFDLDGKPRIGAPDLGAYQLF